MGLRLRAFRIPWPVPQSFCSLQVVFSSARSRESGGAYLCAVRKAPAFPPQIPHLRRIILVPKKTLRGPSIQRDRRDPSLMSGSYGASASACAFKARQAPASSGLRGHLSLRRQKSPTQGFIGSETSVASFSRSERQRKMWSKAAPHVGF